DPNAPKAHYRLGCVYDMKNQYSDAEREYKAAISSNDEDPLPHNRLGNIYFYQIRYADAVEEYKKAIERDSQQGVFYANMAGALYRLNRLDEARSAARDAQQRGYKNHWIYKVLGL